MYERGGKKQPNDLSTPGSQHIVEDSQNYLGNVMVLNSINIELKNTKD